ncbi:MAG: hypothetical protein HRU15_20435 [Planctomycetes bacterium]|nr:hypothetical protein [Planctomycetota bacterium]
MVEEVGSEGENTKDERVVFEVRIAKGDIAKVDELISQKIITQATGDRVKEKLLVDDVKFNIQKPLPGGYIDYQ